MALVLVSFVGEVMWSVWIHVKWFISTIVSNTVGGDLDIARCGSITKLKRKIMDGFKECTESSTELFVGNGVLLASSGVVSVTKLALLVLPFLVVMSTTLEKKTVNMAVLTRDVRISDGVCWSSRSSGDVGKGDLIVGIGVQYKELVHDVLVHVACKKEER